MFASASRLDLRFVLNRKKGGHMDTMSHLPSLPIDIDYSSRRFDPRTKKDVDNMTMSMAAALIRPDRIRQITLEGPIEDLRILFRATEGPLPALESLKIRHESGLYGVDVEIPDTFLEGPNLQLRTLSLHNITLSSISRLLSSVSALTSLDLGFCIGDGQAISQLSHLQDVPSLRHLGLNVVSRTSHTTQPTKAQKRFILPKLTSFRYEGHSSFLNTLVAGFTAPSLRDVDIKLRYTDDINPPILHLSRFIEDAGAHCRSVQIIILRFSFHLSLRGPSEYAGHHPLNFKLDTIPIRNTMVQMSSPFSAMLVTAEELTIHVDNREVEDIVFLWRQFLMQFPSVKVLRMYGDHKASSNHGIACALHYDHGGHNLALLPALEEIELCLGPGLTPAGCAPVLVAFKPFASARQQAGLPVQIVTNMRTHHELWRKGQS